MKNIYLLMKIIWIKCLLIENGDWGLGIGDWGLGIGQIGRAHV